MMNVLDLLRQRGQAGDVAVVTAAPLPEPVVARTIGLRVIQPGQESRGLVPKKP